MMTHEKPEGFVTTLLVSGAVFQVGDEVLLLKRSRDEKYSPSVWALPAGKVNVGESVASACEREIFEETGIHISCEGDTPHVFYHIHEDYPDTKIEFSFFHKVFDTKPDVLMNEEHEEYVWANRDDIKGLELISGEAYVLKHFGF